MGFRILVALLPFLLAITVCDDNLVIEPFFITLYTGSEQPHYTKSSAKNDDRSLILSDKASDDDIDIDIAVHCSNCGERKSVGILDNAKLQSRYPSVLDTYYLKHQENRLRRISRSVKDGPIPRSMSDEFDHSDDIKYLVCKPLGGIGNFVAGLLSCLAIALVTKRHLLLAPPPASPRDNISAYEHPISSFFDFPIDMTLGILGEGINDVPFLFEPSTGAALDTPVLQVTEICFVDWNKSTFVFK
jgi:hypothetical protein